MRPYAQCTQKCLLPTVGLSWSFAGLALSLFAFASCEEGPHAQDSPRQSPPDLSSATRVEIQYAPSTLEHFFPLSWQPSLLSSQERNDLKSSEPFIIDDPEAIKDLAQDVASACYAGPASGAIGIKNVTLITAYHNKTLLARFVIRGPHVLDTAEGHRFRYDGGWPSLRTLLPHRIRQIRSRVGCADNLRTLRWKWRSYFADSQQYPAPSEWCDAVVARSQDAGAGEDEIVRLLKCPGAGEGKCHYAMNPDCELDSPGDTVLLFETKAGWNQNGGPELISFDNHDPKGGCVVLNDGTIKFVRTEEELKQLRWK